MLTERLIVKTQPKADIGNVIYWLDYRVTVLSDRLFRVEKSPNKKFRDAATQAVWFRNMPKQEFTLEGDEFHAIINTGACKLILYKNREQVCVELDGNRLRLDNYGNLLGTYRTLDSCDGDVHFSRWIENDVPYRIQLEKGVCSKTGVAVLNDADSLTLGEDGQVKLERGEGSDEYVFAYGTDFRGALKALYMITGMTPLVPRYALGNWWSRYHIYTDKEYLRLLNRFEEHDVPLTVATVDMDWHYSTDIDKECGISESGKDSPEYVGYPQVNLGWTGYTWNKNLFPDHKDFLQKIKQKNLKITLNVHPSDGIRWWEECYANVAGALGRNPEEQKRIPFDFSYDRFINVYFDLVHGPLEEEGVDFWWIDWQQNPISWHDERPEALAAAFPAEKYDPLWALNHYHYADNQYKRDTPLILSRYAGVGSHRYPLGFSGDTEVSWKTLAYLPYFTATASNIGYTWWSHDIGGHNFGEKSDELYVRHLQFGVFSPINRLHCAYDDTMTKEPWVYGNGAGLIAEKFLRLRHSLIPYLYTASHLTHTEGRALVEPLYYQWQDKQAYSYKEEYLFGSELLVIPVTQKNYPDGFARIRAWIPEGVWTDIFTGDEYVIGEGGSERVLYRELDSIPVLAKAGGILPLSLDKGNSIKNPEKLEIYAFVGNGEYTLYEDGAEEGKQGSMRTRFASEYVETEGAGTQILTISAEGESDIIPENRELLIRFKNIEGGEVRLFIDGELTETEEWLTDCTAIRFAFNPKKIYRIEVVFKAKTRLEKEQTRALDVLIRATGKNTEKFTAWERIVSAKTEEEFLKEVDAAEISDVAKLRLKESL